MKFTLFSKLCLFFNKSVTQLESNISEVATTVTTISDDIKFESVKKTDEFLSQLQGRYNL